MWSRLCVEMCHSTLFCYILSFTCFHLWYMETLNRRIVYLVCQSIFEWPCLSVECPVSFFADERRSFSGMLLHSPFFSSCRKSPSFSVLGAGLIPPSHSHNIISYWFLVDLPWSSHHSVMCSTRLLNEINSPSAKQHSSRTLWELRDIKEWE